jgi:hypothetical protein
MSLLSLLGRHSDPEFTTPVSSRAFQRAWERNGTAKVAAFLSPEETDALIGMVASSYQVLQRRIDVERFALGEDLVANFERWHGLWLAEFLPFLHGCDPAAEHALRDFVAGLARIVSRLFGGVWHFYPERSFFRRLYDQDLYVPWHLDADAARTAARGGRCINIWLPLDPVGSGSPSMELILGSHNRMRNEPLIPTDQPNGHRSEEWAKTVPGRHWIPSLVPGDAVLFDQYLVHRTQPIPVPPSGRTSCEFRFTA